MASSLANLGGVLDYGYDYDYPAPPPPALPCCRVPAPANLRAGTGVFLPRADAYYRGHAAVSGSAPPKGKNQPPPPARPPVLNVSPVLESFCYCIVDPSIQLRMHDRVHGSSINDGLPNKCILGTDSTSCN